jgi:hypothetical protein
MEFGPFVIDHLSTDFSVYNVIDRQGLKSPSGVISLPRTVSKKKAGRTRLFDDAAMTSSLLRLAARSAYSDWARR